MSSHSPHRRQQLEARAHHMRYNPTQAEAILFAAIRAKRFGVQFRRQVIIGEYIVDFYASSIRLVIEVDGPYHQQRLYVAADARRDRRLARMGYRVLRLSNEEVTQRLPAALQRVLAAIG